MNFLTCDFNSVTWFKQLPALSKIFIIWQSNDLNKMKTQQSDADLKEAKAAHQQWASVPLLLCARLAAGLLGQGWGGLLWNVSWAKIIHILKLSYRWQCKLLDNFLFTISETLLFQINIKILRVLWSDPCAKWPSICNVQISYKN